MGDVDQDDVRGAQEGPEDHCCHRPRPVFRGVRVFDLPGGLPGGGCIVEEPDRDGRMVCAVRADLCIGCGLCVTLGNPTAPQQREFGCPPDYDAINMMPFEDVVKALERSGRSHRVGRASGPPKALRSTSTAAGDRFAPP